MSELHLIGVDGGEWRPAARAALAGAKAVFASERLWPRLAGLDGELLPITPLSVALERMAARLVAGDIAVLASGDPLFFGLGRVLSRQLGRERLVVHPALSAMQLAFARLREPWDDAVFVSRHGRGGEGDGLLAKLLRAGKVGVFTDGRQTPAVIAAEIATGLAGLGIEGHRCQVLVAENLGLAGERLVEGSPDQIAAQDFAEPNLMILRLTLPAERGRGFALGLRESEIRHSRGLITKDEVRAAILHRLRLPLTGVFWDIGAGSGSVAVEAARLCPELTVFAVERHPDEQAHILDNRRLFRLPNLRLVAAQAPEGLKGLPAPERVFIGGSGGRLAGIIEAADQAMGPGGRMVVAAVTAATRHAAPELLNRRGSAVSIATIIVQRQGYPPALDSIRDLNPITLITAER